MAHAIMQLKAKGSQDIACIVNPEVTFWRSVYPRHTNFAWDDTVITQSTGSVGYGQTVEFKLPRSGDLVTRCVLFLEVGAVSNWGGKFCPFIWDFGRALIQYFELTIGGYQIERITGDMLHVNDLLSRADYASYVDNMPAKHGAGVKFDKAGKIVEQATGTAKQYLYIPLDFSFTADPGLALPMIALQYHEVRVKVKFNDAGAIFNHRSITEPAYHVIGPVGATLSSGTANTIKAELLGTSATSNSVTTYSLVNENAIRALIRKLYLEGRYGNTMAHLVEQEGNLRWVNYVIENAMYTDKVTMTASSTVGASSLSVTYTAGTAPTVSSGAISVVGAYPTMKITFKIPLYNSDQVFEIPDAVIPREYKFTPTSYTTTANDRATWIAQPPSLAAKLICRYIYLDDFERRQFAVNPHEYLITEYQHHQQFLGANTDQVVVDLKFNHPTKELIFFYRPDEWWTEDLKDYYKGYWSFKNVASSFGEGHLFTTANLILNSQNVYADGRDPVYFDYVVPNQFHKRVDKDSHVYVIPFSMQPDSWKPSGSINMSRLDDVKLVLKGMGTTTPAGTLNVYAKNFNVMKIMNGMGGKRYAS